MDIYKVQTEKRLDMKNCFIELERFIAACLVLLYHLGVSKGSWIFVEFFFMLTGYFTMLHLERKSETIGDNIWYPVFYTWKKFVKIFPYTGISILAMWLGRIIKWNLSAKDLVKWILCLPTELGLLAGTGMQPTGLQIAEGAYTPKLLNVHLWYICSMLIVMPIVVGLLMWARKYKSVIVTVVPMLLYGILIMKDGTINGWHNDTFTFIFCNMRAMAGLLLGAGAYYFTQWWKSREYTVLGKKVLTAIELISFAGVALISFSTALRFDALQIGLLFLSISLTNSGLTYTTQISDKRLEFLGAISLPIYCMQMPVIWWCSVIGAEGAFTPFVITLVLSVVIEIAFKLFDKWYEKSKEIIKGWMIA